MKSWWKVLGARTRAASVVASLVPMLGVAAMGAVTAGSAGCNKDEPKGTISQEKKEGSQDKGAASAGTAQAEGAAKVEGGTPPAPEVAKVEEPAAEGGEKPAAEGDGAEMEQIEGPVATVNGKPVSKEEYYSELKKIQKHGAKIPDERLTRIKENILKRLIEAELISQAIAKESIAVPDADIEKAFAEYKDRFKSDEQFQNYLKHGNLKIEDIKARIQEKRALELLIEKKGTLGVTDAEAQEFYEKNKRFYQEKEAVHAMHILAKVDKEATKEMEDAALAKIAEAQEALKKGESFEEVAKRISEGPSAPKGGDLGSFTRGQMVKPFEDKAFSMKPGEVSEPVRTRFGYHIIKVIEKKDESQKPFEEVKDQIFESLKNKKFFQERRTLLENLEKEAKIEKFVG